MSGFDESPIKVATKTASGGTFAQLQTIINGASAGDTISITGDYYWGGGSAAKNGVELTKRVTIVGNGHTLDGKGVSRIFRVNTANCVITGINFINGYTATTYSDTGYVGGAIAAKVNVNVNFCNFTNCVGDGGAAYCQAKGTGTISNCTFMYNTAKYIATTNQDSIILSILNSGTVRISNCVIANNKANSATSDSSGGQYIIALSGSGDTFSNNVFYNNTASLQGIGRLNNLNEANYNWFGSNSPDFSKIVSADTPYNWIVMNFTNTTPVPSVSSGGSVILSVEFNKIYVHSSKSYSPLAGGIAPRTVKFSDNGVGSFNVSQLTFNGVCYVNYTFPAGTSNIIVYATIDDQTLKIRFPDPIGSFTELQQLIDATPSGGTISLTKDYEYEPRWDLPYAHGMTINKPLNIIGNGHSINGIGDARIFQITGSYVNLTNISFINGYPISKVNSGYYGGVIYSTGSYLKVTSCNFENNSATSTSTNGGIIYCTGTGSSFEYNSFYKNTGKVYVSSNVNET